MAVREGFEPSMQLLTAYSLSRGAPSASRPPHHTPLTSASKNLFIAHRRCVAHILLSQPEKSNNFSQLFTNIGSFEHFTNKLMRLSARKAKKELNTMISLMKNHSSILSHRRIILFPLLIIMNRMISSKKTFNSVNQNKRIV